MGRLAVICALATGLVLATNPPALANPPTTPVCADAKACETACKDGAGDAAACTALADILVAGRKVSPDRARAATLYRAACGLPPGATEDTPPAATGDYHACSALADLTKTGWLFEIDKDADLHRQLVDRAVDLAAPHCTATDTAGCAVAAQNAREQYILSPATTDATVAGKYAELGCATGRDPDACNMVNDYARVVDKDTEVTRLRAVARTGFADACIKDGNGKGCVESDLNDAKIRAAADKVCAAGDMDTCAAVWIIQLHAARKDPAKLKDIAAQMVKGCDGDGYSICDTIAAQVMVGREKFGFVADPANAASIALRQCDLGYPDACEVLAAAMGPKGVDSLKNLDQAKIVANRACDLTNPAKDCSVCKSDATLAACMHRAAFHEREQCYASEVGACERIAARFRDGIGVPVDVAEAARYLRRGCDSAEKAACATLDELCVANPKLDNNLCEQALIHTDLFYEAEYQQELNGSANLLDPNAPATGATTASPSTVAMGADAASGGAGLELKRGKLDADLVVDIVLDRARQAAIKLVVDQLISAEDKARYRYLSDLLDQGAALLADPSTLRREKFQDLGMTVVRAFVAANLIEGLYPTSDELDKAPVIGPTVFDDKARAELKIVAGKELPAALHGYLVDVAYRWLGATRLFGRSAAQSGDPPPCPWKDGAGATLCTQLAVDANVEKALKVDKVMDGLRLAKALREGGFDDLRRLIEAVSRSRTIADLGKTPGLNLDAWTSVLVYGSRDKVATLRAQLVDLRAMTRVSLYADTGSDLAALAKRAANARAMLDSTAIRRLVVGSDNARHIMAIVRAIEAVAPKDRANTTGLGGAAAAAVVDPDALAKVRKLAIAEIQAWGARDVGDLGKKLDSVDTELDALKTSIDQLATAIAELAALFARFPKDDGSITLDVSALPLYAVGDFAKELRSAATALGGIEDHLRKIYPGEVQPQLQFARSATVRLLGFLDLMERVARSSRLTQTCGDIVAAIGTLGSTRKGEFTAPLYDVLEPVLGAIKTHEPMSLDLLFAVIGRVRLDTLISSLQGTGNACKDDGSVDCWTTKLIHALQESVEREGDVIRVDGGKFAQRLAKQGDDFRRKHTWRGYFHLTVGFGALNSAPIDMPTDQRRTVPLISEQIGFGFASPAFFGDNVTFKIGAAGSGLLYRAVVDSKESGAIMVHPIFLALDFGDLIEAYISPAMLLVYPPDDTHGTEVRWGIGAGLNVPLSAYLERLK